MLVIDLIGATTYCHSHYQELPHQDIAVLNTSSPGDRCVSRVLSVGSVREAPDSNSEVSYIRNFAISAILYFGNFGIRISRFQKQKIAKSSGSFVLETLKLVFRGF